jgi:hypothetical protein
MDSTATKQTPKVLKKYYTPREVSEHNVPEDLWVSFLGTVYNLTPLVHKYKGILSLCCFFLFYAELAKLRRPAPHSYLEIRWF